MDGVDNRFEKPLRNAIAKFRAESAADREKIYAAARASLKRVQSADSADAASLETAIEAIEASFRPAAAAPSSPLGRLMAMRAIAIPLACLVIGTGVGATVASSWSSNAPTGSKPAAQKLGQLYDRGAAKLPVASAYLHQVVDAIIDKQTKDRSAFAASAKGFIPLQTFDKDLAEQMPKSLPPGTAVVVKADAYNFKVLMNWPLCGIASISSPGMVDRVRTTNMTVGCPYFGLWSSGAANW